MHSIRRKRARLTGAAAGPGGRAAYGVGMPPVTASVSPST